MSESEENTHIAPEEENITIQERVPEEKPDTPEEKPDTPEKKPDKPEEKPKTTEGDENAENERREKLQKNDKKSKISEGKNTKNEGKEKQQKDKKSETKEGEKGKNEKQQKGDKQEQIYTEKTYKPKCNIRIEELAKPNKNQVRTVYTGYKHVLPKRNIQVVNDYLKEEYAKTPEEAEQIFKKLRRNEKESECRNVCEKEAKKKHTEKINDKKRQKMLDILADILKKYMLKAHSNPKQIIMTNRLRNLSSMVLEKLCEIRNINVPHRESTSIRATLMHAVSDYFAFCINTIYYEMQLKKIKDYEELKPLPEQKRVRKSYENAAVKPKGSKV